MSNILQLHHFGEMLVSDIISALGPKKFQKFLSKHAFMPGKDSTKKVPKFQFNQMKTECFAKLESKQGFSFDSESNIDVTIFYKKNKTDLCFPIEVKMGAKGSMVNWSTFCKYLDKKAITPKKDNKKVLNGCMSSFLSHTAKDETDYKFYAKSSKSSKDLEAPIKYWGLCIMGSKKSFQMESSYPLSNTKVQPIVFRYEDLKSFAMAENIEVERQLRKKLNAEVARILKEFKAA
jgi:hypothetical protein